MPTHLHILLTLSDDPGDIQEFEMRVPIELLYCGFKISFLATASLEEMLFKLVVENAPNAVKRNARSDSLEELLLALPEDSFSVVKPHYALHIARVEVS